MVTLEELLYQKLVQNNELAGLLTSYSGKPAIFETLAPADEDSGWAGAQAPRIEFSVTRQEDSERNVSGQIIFSAYDLDESMVTIGQIANGLQNILNGSVFRPDEGTIFLRWVSASPFEQDPDYRGVEVAFDLLAFPSQTTISPDPVLALNSWTAAKFPELQVDPATWAPTDNAPAIYWRFSGTQGATRTAGATWLDVALNAHILAPTPGGRLPWLKRLVEALVQGPRIYLDDGSPLFIQQVAADNQADHLRTGQLRVTVKYGVLQDKIPAQTLVKTNIKGA